ncbi:MAG: hypothetical protein WAK08_15180 [Pseudolabrys sp.]
MIAIHPAMPRDGPIIFSDLIGKLDVLRVSCDKCGRDGCYGLGRLIKKRGRDAMLIDWLDELTAECPKKIAHNRNDPRGARCQDLAKVRGVGATALIAQGGLYAVSRHHHSRASARVMALSVRHPGNNLHSAIVRHQSLSPFIFSSAAINSATRRSANSVRKRNSKSGVSASIKATPCRCY